MLIFMLFACLYNIVCFPLRYILFIGSIFILPYLASFLIFIEDCSFCHPSLRPIIVVIHRRAKICKCHFFISDLQTRHIEKGALLTTLLCRNENAKGTRWQGGVVGWCWYTKLAFLGFCTGNNCFGFAAARVELQCFDKEAKMAALWSKQQAAGGLGGVGWSWVHFAPLVRKTSEGGAGCGGDTVDWFSWSSLYMGS